MTNTEHIKALGRKTAVKLDTAKRAMLLGMPQTPTVNSRGIDIQENAVLEVVILETRQSFVVGMPQAAARTIPYWS
jgi:hypothetical protein